MAYSDNFPATRPVFMADFANGGKIDPRATFTRASTANVWDGSKHLSSENLVLQSQDFDTTWTQYQLASSGGLTGSQSAPDGTTTAWLVTAGTLSPGAPFLNQTLSGIASSTEYTASVYLKAGTASHGYITLRGQFSHLAWAEIDFASPLSPTTGGVNFTSISATSTAVGSTGWYRLTLTCTTSAVASPKAYVGPSDGTDPGLYGEAVWNCAGETIYVWGYQLEERGSATVYNATTTQIHREYASSLVSKANNVGRFDYSTDGQSMGILIEGQAQNLLPYSVGTSSWTLSQASRTSAAAIAPDGTQQAVLITWNGSSGSGYAFPSLGTVTSGTVYTGSVYVKAVGSSSIMQLTLNAPAFASDNAVNFTLTGDGSVGSSFGGATGAISSIGNGWYRVSITATAASSSSACPIVVPITSTTDARLPSFTSNRYDGLLCWGFQLEANSFPSSLVSSNGSATTRASESLSMTDSSLFDNGGGALYVESSSIDKSAAYSGIASLNDGSGSNKVELLNYFSYIRGNVTASGSQQSDHYGSSFGSNVPFKACITYDTNNVSLYANGNEIGATDTSAALPSVDRITLGNLSGGGDYLNGHLKRVAVYSEPISEAAAAALTS